MADGTNDLIVDVDIATRMVGDDEDVYIVRPGANYALYAEFTRKSRVFLDFPGLGLTLERKPENSTELREMIARSLDVRDWHLAKRETAEPSRDIASYRDKARGRRFGRYASAIQKLYYELPEGTIIVVPGPGYVSDVLIGVLVGPPSRADDIDAYPGEVMPVRAVEWLGKQQRARFSEELRDRLGNSHPVMALDRSMREEILEAGFERFVFKGQFYAKLETTEAEFSTLDDYNIQTFVNLVAGAMAARDAGFDEAHGLTLQRSLEFLRANRDLIPELSININSPGFLRLASDRIAPLVIAVLFSVALTVPAGAQPVALNVINSVAAANDPCAITVSAEAMGAMKLMAYDEWKGACEKARDAEHATGVKTNMSTHVHHAPKHKQ
jgi:hypothetical protein